jgi:methionine sulfoxide reductase heme-binding subunit
VVATGLLPAAWLAVRAARGRLGAEPIETLTHFTGDWALRLLLASLAVTPARRLLGAPALAPYRRSLGLLAFFYACLHLAVYLFLDQGLDARAILEDVAKRPYVTAGLTAFLCLAPLAATSTRGTMRRLGRRAWLRLHRLAYVAAAAAVVHFLWLVKADLREPLIYAGVLAALLAARLVPARRGLRRSAAPPAGSRSG